MILLFLLGIISASGFSAHYIKQTEQQNSMITIQGKTYEMANKDDGKTKLTTTVLGDYVITDIQMINNERIIYYESKPLIYVMWCGGFGMLGYLLVVMIQSRKRRMYP